jgi:hypothetical protein
MSSSTPTTATNASPFDEALSRPFLDEPIKKKWRLAKSTPWFSTKKSKSNTLSNSNPFRKNVVDDDDEEDCDTVSFTSSSSSDNDDSYSTSNNPFDESFDELISGNGGANNNNNNNNKTTLTLLVKQAIQIVGKTLPPHIPTEMELTVEQDILSMELAILREREIELGEIRTSMKQIHTIQQDMALLVCEQGTNIHRLSDSSADARDHAQAGLDELLEADRRAGRGKKQQQQQQHSSLGIFVTDLVTDVCLMLNSLLFSEEEHTPELAQSLLQCDSLTAE